MNRLWKLGTMCLLAFALHAQEGPKQEAKDAGKDAKRATKHAGKAVTKGTKKAVNKTAQETEKGARSEGQNQGVEESDPLAGEKCDTGLINNQIIKGDKSYAK